MNGDPTNKPALLAEEQYLGDGVHARFDGEYVILRASRDGHGDHVIYLDRGVFQRVKEFAKEVFGE